MAPMLVVGVTASKIVRLKKRPYTLFEIEVFSSISNDAWLLYKRIRDMRTVEKMLVDEINQLGLDQSKVHLPQFIIPQRRFVTASTWQNNVKKELQNYLQSLITNATFCYNDILFDFFEVDMGLRTMIKQYDQLESTLYDKGAK